MNASKYIIFIVLILPIYSKKKKKKSCQNINIKCICIKLYIGVENIFNFNLFKPVMSTVL